MTGRSRLLIVLGLAGIAACWAATGLVGGLRGVPGTEVDAAWAEAATAARDPVTVGVSDVLAAAGGAPWSIVIAVGLAVLIGLRRGVRPAVAFVAAALLSQLLVRAMKLVDLRPGPGGELFGGAGSFPSGHTAFAAVIAVTGAALLPRPMVRVLAVALVITMALSRTVIAAHWLTDTLGGAVLGAATAVLVHGLVGTGGTRGGGQDGGRSPSSSSAVRPSPD